jgi:hypothetical protein
MNVNVPRKKKGMLMSSKEVKPSIPAYHRIPALREVKLSQIYVIFISLRLAAVFERLILIGV